MAKKQRNMLELYRDTVSDAKITCDSENGAFFVSISLAGLDGRDNSDVKQFVADLNEAVTHQVNISPEPDRTIRFELKNASTRAYTTATASFARFKDAQRCLSMVKKCDLPIDRQVSAELEEFGKARDAWLDRQKSRGLLARLFSKGEPPPVFKRVELKPKLDLGVDAEREWQGRQAEREQERQERRASGGRD